jgi:hypothetical protein
MLEGGSMGLGDDRRRPALLRLSCRKTKKAVSSVASASRWPVAWGGLLLGGGHWCTRSGGRGGFRQRSLTVATSVG